MMKEKAVMSDEGEGGGGKALVVLLALQLLLGKQLHSLPHQSQGLA